MRISTYYQFQRQSAFISSQYKQMSTLVSQQSTGVKLQHSSEDPVLAGQIQATLDYKNNIGIYDKNGVFASDRVSLIGTQMQAAINNVTHIQSVIKQALNGTAGSGTREQAANQLRGILTNLLSIANTKDTQSEGYIFSGFNAQTIPYALSGGSYQYQGGFESSTIQIGQDVSTGYNESGFAVFGDISQANGTFTVAAGAGNIGGASTDPGTVDAANYVADTYTISFVTNSAGQLAYQVVGAASGQVIPPSPQPIPGNAPAYESGQPISFNGVTLTVSDTTNPPRVGDTFTVEPAAKENIFNSLQGLIDGLETPDLNSANLQQILLQADATFSRVSNHLITYQSQVSARETTINAQKGTNSALIFNQTLLLSNLQDVDLPQVASQFLQKQSTLEAAMDSYKLFMQTLSNILKL